MMVSIFSFMLVSMAMVAMTPTHARKAEFTPFQEPGVSSPGIDYRFLIKAAGAFWSQPRLIDSIAYACMDILPQLADALQTGIPPDSLLADFPPDGWQPICSLVLDATDDPNGFDPVGLCNTVFSELFNPRLSPDEFDERRSRQGLDPENVFQTLINITMNVYGIDPKDPYTTCQNAEYFLTSFYPATEFTVLSEFLSTIMPLLKSYGHDGCDNWDAFISDVLGNLDRSVVDGLGRVFAEILDFESKADFCEALEVALAAGENERKTLVARIVRNIFRVPTEPDFCEKILEDTMEVLGPMYGSSEFYRVTGFRSTAYLCDALADSFGGTGDHIAQVQDRPYHGTVKFPKHK